MRAVGVRVEQRDGDCIGRSSDNFRDDVRNARVRERFEHTLRHDAFAYRYDIGRRHQWLRMMSRQVVEGRTFLPTQLQEIGEAGGRAGDHARAAPLQQQIRHHGGSVRNVGQ